MQLVSTSYQVQPHLFLQFVCVQPEVLCFAGRLLEGNGQCVSVVDSSVLRKP